MAERAKVSVKKPEAKRENRPSQTQKIGPSQSISSPVEQILFLQRTIGNQAVGELIKSGALKAKLRIGQPGDIYEQEADRIAEQVMRMPEPQVSKETKVSNSARNNLIQRKCPGCNKGTKIGKEEEEEKLWKKEASGPTPEVTPELESSISAVRGGGQPLPEPVRAFYEPRFGHDFSGVRVHTDANAVETARAVNARAYTVGRDIVFGARQNALGTTEGKKILAHELTHIMQQESTPVAGTARSRSLTISDALASFAPIPIRHANNSPKIQRQVAGGSGILPVLMPTILAAPMVGGVVTPDQFKFKNVVPYSGPGPGGWKVACVIVRFAKISQLAPAVFTCDIEVGVPEINFKGPVSNSFAQVESSTAANQAAQIVLQKYYHQLPAAAGMVCIEFRKEMQKILQAAIPGARVTMCTTPGIVPVIVGKEKEEADKRCFIATAAYGSPLAAELDILRSFRDRHLLSTREGRVFVRTYYKCSPPIARFIAKHPILRAGVRCLLKPVVAWTHQKLEDDKLK